MQNFYLFFTLATISVNVYVSIHIDRHTFEIVFMFPYALNSSQNIKYVCKQVSINLITHTNTCTHIYIYIYYLRSPKFTLKHLKRSYMFRSHDHPQGAYIVPC